MVKFHVEPTSKCTLECPLCDRTWFYNKFKKRLIHEIDIDALVNFVGDNAIVDMCGNNGDPIYHSQFYQLCVALKDKNCQLSITTNGSAKPKSWWQSISKVLDEKDQVVFSIDGLEDTNHLYRINSKWQSVMDAVGVMKDSKCKMIWKFIVFKHNQHQIDDAKKLCYELGFDSFRLEKSDRWTGGEKFMPDEIHVDQYYKHQQKILKDNEYKTSMKPFCLVNDKPERGLYIDAEGNFFPCCWMGTYRYKFRSIFNPSKGKNFNIAKKSVQDILNNEEVIDFFKSTKQFTSAHECCKIQCGVTNG